MYLDLTKTGTVYLRSNKSSCNTWLRARQRESSDEDTITMKKILLSMSLVVLGGLMTSTASASTVLCTSPAITNVITSLGVGTGNACDVTGALSVLFSNFRVSPTSATVGIDTTSGLVGNQILLGFQLSGVVLDASGNFDIHLLYEVTGGI